MDYGQVLATIATKRARLARLARVISDLWMEGALRIADCPKGCGASLDEDGFCEKCSDYTIYALQTDLGIELSDFARERLDKVRAERKASKIFQRQQAEQEAYAQNELLDKMAEGIANSRKIVADGLHELTDAEIKQRRAAGKARLQDMTLEERSQIAALNGKAKAARVLSLPGNVLAKRVVQIATQEDDTVQLPKSIDPEEAARIVRICLEAQEGRQIDPGGFVAFCRARKVFEFVKSDDDLKNVFANALHDFPDRFGRRGSTGYLLTSG